MSDTFTIVGARGFIGTALAAALRSGGHEVRTRRSDEDSAGDRGHVIYVSGVAWGAETRPADAYETHVDRVRLALGNSRIESFTFVSSTRVYDGAAATTEETPLMMRPSNPGDVYPISKIAGENLVLSDPAGRGRVVRLSNVFGPSFRSELFLSQVLRSAARDGFVCVRTSRDSAKDYVGIGDVVRILPQIARGGRERIYNLAHGENTTNGAILDALARAGGVRIEVALDAKTVVTPPISIARLAAEFGVPTERVEDAIPSLFRSFADAQRVSTVGA